MRRCAASRGAAPVPVSRLLRPKIVCVCRVRSASRGRATRTVPLLRVPAPPAPSRWSWPRACVRPVRSTHDNRPDDHGSTTQKPLQNSEKWHFWRKFSPPAARFKGFAWGTVPDSPGSGTPSWTLMLSVTGPRAHPRHPSRRRVLMSRPLRARSPFMTALLWHSHSASFLLAAVAAEESCAHGRVHRPRTYSSFL